MAIETKPNISVKWAASGATTQPTTAKTQQGWISEIPTYQAQNWWQNRVDSFLNHVNQAGVPLWDSSTSYTSNSSIVQYQGTLYLALVDSVGVLPTNSASWTQLIDLTRYVPAGAVEDFALTSAPSGWLACSGQAVSRTAYAGLFSAIGTTWGAGNGSTTFNLPDFRGYFRRGWDNGRGIDQGRVLFSFQDSANLSHTHTGTTTGGGSHNHTGTTDVNGWHSHSGTTAGSGDHTHWFTIYSRTGAGEDNKTADSGGNPEKTTTTSSAGFHTHTFNTDGSGNHQHGFTTSTVGDHTHTLSVTASGGLESRPRNVALLTCIKY